MHRAEATCRYKWYCRLFRITSKNILFVATINYVRNICAHHARLWNRDLNIVPEKLSFSKTLDWISNPDTAKRSKLYYFLCMLNYMLQTANPTSPFKKKLKALLTENEDIISLNAMGFFENWENEIIWNNKK